MDYFFRLVARGLLYAPSHMSWPLLHQSWSTDWSETLLHGSTISDRSDDPSHHFRTLYHGATSRSDISCTYIFFSSILYTSDNTLYTMKHVKKMYYKTTAVPNTLIVQIIYRIASCFVCCSLSTKQLICVTFIGTYVLKTLS